MQPTSINDLRLSNSWASVSIQQMSSRVCIWETILSLSHIEARILAQALIEAADNPPKVDYIKLDVVVTDDTIKKPYGTAAAEWMDVIH